MREHFGGTTKTLRPSDRHGRLGRSEQTSPTVGANKPGPGSMPGFGFIRRRRNPACAAGSFVGGDQSRLGRDQISWRPSSPSTSIRVA